MQNIKQLLIFSLSGSLTVAVGAYLITTGRTIGQALFGRGFAEKELKHYAATVLNQDVRRVRCQAIDSDENGYVSCEYTTVSEPGVPRTLQCAAWGLDSFRNPGCKSPTPLFPGQ